MASVRPGWSSCLLAQASTFGDPSAAVSHWRAEPKRHRGKSGNCPSGQQRLARGRGSSRADRSIPAPQLFDRNANYASLHHAKRTGSTQRYINYPAFDERPAIIDPAAY